MAVQQITLPFRPVINLSGGIDPFATLDVYQSGTTTRVSVFSDAALTTTLTNPVVANSAGVFPAIYYDDATAIRIVLKFADGTVVPNGDIDPFIADFGTAEKAADEASAYATSAATFASQASSSAASAAIYTSDLAALASIDYFVDATSGSNSNNGLTEATAFATIQAARAVASANDVIGVKRGQTHFIQPGETDQSNMLQSLVGYGTSPNPAIISAGQSLSGKTWTLYSGDVWTTQISLLSNHISGGTGSNTTYPLVRFGDNEFTWAVGGADIAANLTALASLNGGFAINVNGDTNQDIRNATATSGPFDLYVRMPDGSDPNGVDLITMFAQNCYKFDCELLQDVELTDAFGKDTTGAIGGTLTNTPRLRRVRVTRCGASGWVGAAEGWGLYLSASPRQGMPGAAFGYSEGSGLNFFSPQDRMGVTLINRGVEAHNFGTGIYGHVSTAGDVFAHRIEFHDAIDAGWENCKIRNCNAGLQTDSMAGERVLTDGLYIYTGIDWEVRANAYVISDKVHTLGGGTIAFKQAANPLNRQVIVNGNGPAIDAKIAGVTFSAEVQNSISFEKLLYRIANNYSAADPAIEFANCTLPTEGSDDHFFLPQGVQSQADANLTLSIGTVTGDIIASGRTIYPISVTVTHDVTFGLGDQTSRANVRSLLTAASVTHSIDNDTTLLRLDGTVAENPA